MGCVCGTNKDETIFDKTNPKLERLEVESFDKVMDQAEPILSEIEQIRSKISKSYGEFLIQSGAVVLAKPEIVSGLLGMIFQIGRDINPQLIEGDFMKLIHVKSESPFIQFNEVKGVSIPESIMKTKDRVIEFFETLFGLKDNLETIKKQIEEILSTIEENVKKWPEDFLAKVGGNPFNLGPLLSKADKNKKAILRGFTLVKEVLTIIGNIPTSVSGLVTKLKKPEEINKLKTLVDASKNKENTDNCKLYWNYTTDEKLPTFEEHLNLVHKIREEPLEQIPKKDEKKKEEKKEEKKKDEKKEEKKEEKNSNTSDPETEKKYQEILKKYNDLQKVFEENKSTKKGLTKIFINKFNPLKSWNLTLTNSFQVENNSYPKSFSIIHENDTFAVGTSNGKIQIFSLESFDQLYKSDKLHNGAIKSLTYLSDGSTLISGGKDGRLIKFDVNSKSSKEFNSSFDKPISGIAYPLDGESVVVSSGNKLHIFDIITLDLIASVDVFAKEKITNLIYIKVSKAFVTSGNEGSIAIFDSETRTKILEYKEHSQKINGISFCKFKGSLVIVSSSNDQTIKIFGINEKKILKVLNIPSKSNNNAAKSLFYGFDERTIISTHNDGKVFLHNITSDNSKVEHANKPFFSNQDKITGIIYSGDGSTIITGNKSGNVDIYQAK